MTHGQANAVIALLEAIAVIAFGIFLALAVIVREMIRKGDRHG